MIRMNMKNKKEMMMIMMMMMRWDDMIWYDRIPNWLLWGWPPSKGKSTLIQSYPLISPLIHSYPLLSHSYPTLINSYPLLSYLIALLSNYDSLLILRVMLFTLLHSYPILTKMVFRINGIYSILIWTGVSMGEMVAQNESQRERLGCSGWLQSGTGGTSQTLASCKFACPSAVGILLTFGSVLGRRTQLGIFQTSATNEILIWS